MGAPWQPNHSRQPGEGAQIVISNTIGGQDEAAYSYYIKEKPYVLDNLLSRKENKSAGDGKDSLHSIQMQTEPVK